MMAQSQRAQASAVSETDRQHPIVGPIVQLLRYFNAPLLRWLQPANPTPERTQFIHVPTPTNPLQDGTVVSFTCDVNGKSIISDDGIKLVIPRGAVKSGDSVTFEIAVGFCGPFVFLPDYQLDVQLVSPFYWIGVSGSYRFEKPVQVEFEHSAIVTDPSNYSLMACEDGDQTHTMRPVNHDLKFKDQGDVALCTFETFHFCSYCLSHKHKEQSQNMKRIGAFYLKPVNFQALIHFTVEIWFSFTTSYCIRRNEELYKKKGMKLDCSYSFEASCSADKNIASYFGLSYQHDIYGWCVDHSRSTEILTNEANFYYYYKDVEELLAHEESSLFPPCFIVNVIKKPNCITDLNTNITVTLHKKSKDQILKDSISFKLFVPVFPIDAKASNCTSQGTLDLHRLMRCLRPLNDVVEGDLYYFTTCLLPENGVKVVEDIKFSSMNKEDKIRKICEAFLSEKGASWTRLYKALKTVEFHSLAETVKSCYLEVFD